MIKKVIEIVRGRDADDRIELNWFDMQKPNLTGSSKQGVSFVVKAKFTHLHAGDVLVCDDGHRIAVGRAEDDLWELTFSDMLSCAKMAYEIGNRHQPIHIEPGKIIVLDDISLNDILAACKADEDIEVKRARGLFTPTGRAHHSH
jgi:urease accessory protein